MSRLETSGRLGSVLGLLRGDVGSSLLFFVLGLVLRGVPEVLVSVYPVGYETITYYAPAIVAFSGRGLGEVFVEFFGAGPLFYVLMWLASAVSGADAFVLLKVVGPVLYGLLAVAFFVFLRRGLGFEWRLAFVGCLVLVFQPVALRESWDRFRTVLGLVFLFFGLTVLKSRLGFRFKWVLVGVFGVLAVLSREYVGFVLFVAVLGYAVWERRDMLVSAVALVPAVLVFVAMFRPVGQFWDYFSVGNPFVSGSYFWMVQDAFSIFLVCYVPLLFFVVRGFWRDGLVGSVVGWLFLGSFSFVVSPWFAVPGYQRWLMLLVFPFSVYAVLGFERLRLFSGRRLWGLVSVLLVFMVIGAGYSSGGFSYVGLLPNGYVAVDLVESSIPWGRVDDVRAVLKWLDQNAVSGSAVLVEERFYGWTLLYFERADVDVRVVPFGAGGSPFSVLEAALDGNVGRVYWVSFSGSDADGFSVVFSWNDVTVSEYGLVAG